MTPRQDKDELLKNLGAAFVQNMTVSEGFKNLSGASFMKVWGVKNTSFSMRFARDDHRHIQLLKQTSFH